MTFPRSVSPKFLCIVLCVAITASFAGCGTTWRVEYQNPQYGGGAVEFKLPKKEGYAK